MGVCGYALGAFESRAFYARYEAEWRPDLCARFPAPEGDPAAWNRVQQAHHGYHHPDYFCPEPCEAYPSHLHIDLLPRAQGRGYGRRMLEQLMDTLARRRLARSTPWREHAEPARVRLLPAPRISELIRVGSEQDGCIYMGITFDSEP